MRRRAEIVAYHAAGRFAVLAALLILAPAGCAERAEITAGAREVELLRPAEIDARAERVRRDPLGYVQHVAARTRELKQYTLVLTRQERRGMFDMLYGPERIACWFRREPFSVRMKWLDEDVKYGESTYVAGRWNDRVRFVPRYGLFGLPPAVVSVSLQTPVTWGETRFPVTGFGLERLMEQTLESIANSGDEYILRYLGITTFGDSADPVHHLRFEFPPSPGEPSVQELFVDVRTDLPRGTLLKEPSGRLEAAYIYEDLDTSVSLTDEDFELEWVRQRRREHPVQAAEDS